MLSASAAIVAGELLIDGDLTGNHRDNVVLSLSSAGKIVVRDIESSGSVLLGEFAPSDITTGKITINLGEANDTLSLPLIRDDMQSFMITVVGGDGTDEVTLTSNVGPAGHDPTLNIAAETIRIGNATTPPTSTSYASSGMTLAGNVELVGNVSITTGGGDFDAAQATFTGLTAGLDFSLDAGGGAVDLGMFHVPSSRFRVDDVAILDAGDVVLHGALDVGSLHVAGTSITIHDDVNAHAAGITLQSEDVLTINDPDVDETVTIDTHGHDLTLVSGVVSGMTGESAFDFEVGTLFQSSGTDVGDTVAIRPLDAATPIEIGAPLMPDPAAMAIAPAQFALFTGFDGFEIGSAAQSGMIGVFAPLTITGDLHLHAGMGDILIGALVTATGTATMTGDGDTTTLLANMMAATLVFNDSVRVGADVTLTATTGNISFNDTVDSVKDEHHALTLVDPLTTTFAAAVGASDSLSSLTTTSDGLTRFSGPSVTTTGGQTYGDNVQLDGDVVFASTGMGTIDFGGTLTGGNFDLTVNTGGTTRFNNSVSGVDALTTDAPGSTAINTAQISGATLVFRDDVVLEVSSTVDGSSRVEFGKTVNSLANRLLTLVATSTGMGGDVVFSGLVGAGTNGELGSLTVTADDSISVVGATTDPGGLRGPGGHQSYTATTVTTTGDYETGGGNFLVDGVWRLAGDTNVVTDGGLIDGSAATLTAAASGVSLALDAGGMPADGDIELGAADDSGGERVQDLTINDGADVDLGVVGTLSIAGNLAVTASGTTFLLSDVITAGGSVVIDTPLMVSGDRRIDSGDGQAAAAGGLIELGGPIGAEDASGNSLTLDARGSMTSGDVDVQADVGNAADMVAGAAAIQLNGLTVFGAQVDLAQVEVTGGNIDITGSAINLNAALYQTTTSGDVIFGGAVTLAASGTGVVVDSADDASFQSTIAGGGLDLTVNAPGTTTFGGNVSGVDALQTDAGGTTAINAAAITTTGQQNYHDPVTLGADTVLTGVDTDSNGAGVEFADTVTGNAHDLTISGGGLFAAAVSGIDAFAADDIETAATLSANSVAVSGDSELGGNVTALTGSIMLGDAAGDDVSLTTDVTLMAADAIALSGNVSGPHNLTFNAVNGSTVAGTIGPDIQDLTVRTSGLTAGTIDIDGDLDADFDVSTTVGGLLVDGDVTANGKLMSAGGVNVGETSTLGGDVTSVGNQSYAGAVTLTDSIHISTTGGAGDVTFNSTVDGQSGQGHALTIDSVDDVLFGDAVGGLHALGSLSVSATTSIAAGSVTTSAGVAGSTGDQSYTASTASLGGTYTTGGGDLIVDGSLVLTSDVVVSAVAATFLGTINAQTAGTQGLTVNASGVTQFSGRIGDGAALSRLRTNSGGGTTINTDRVTTSGQQEYGDAVTLGADVVLTGADTGTDGEGIEFASTLAGNSHDLDVVGGAFFGAAVSGVDAFRADRLDADSTLSANSVTVTGDSDLGGNVTALTGSISLGDAAADDVTLTGHVQLTAADVVSVSGSIIGPFDVTFNAAVSSSVAGTIGPNVHNVTVRSSALTAGTIDITGNLDADFDVTTTIGGILVDETATADGRLTSATSIDVGGAATLAGNVTSTGDQHFAGPVTLANSILFSTGTGPGNVTFDGAVNSAAGGLFALTAQAGAGAVNFGGNVGNGAGGELGGLTVTTTGPVNFDGTVRLAGNLDVTGGAVSFDNDVTTLLGGTVEITNGSSLVIASGADFATDGAWTQNGAGSVNLGGNITTTGDAVSFSGAVTLGNNIAVVTTSGVPAGGPITFGSTLNAVAAGAQSLQLVAGTGGDVSFAGAVGDAQELGAVTITTARDVTVGSTFEAESLVQAAGSGTTKFVGVVTLSGAAGADVTTNAVFMQNDALIDAGSARIRIDAVQNITLGGLRTTSAAADAVRLISRTGGIVDGGDAHLEVDAANGTLIIDAAAGIGDGNPLEIDVAQLVVRNTAAGQINLSELNAVSVLELSQGNAAAASLTTVNGAITVAAGGVGITAIGPVSLSAGGTLSDIVLQQDITTAATGSVSLTAGRDILDDGIAGTQITTGDLSLNARRNIGQITDFAAGAGTPVDMNLSGVLQQAVITEAGGAIFLRFAGDIRAAASAINPDADGAATVLIDAQGNIDFGALQSIVLTPGDNLGLQSGGTLTLPDAGFDVGGGSLRLAGAVDVVDASGRELGPLVANELSIASGSVGGATTLNTNVNVLHVDLTAAAAGTALVVNEADGVRLESIRTNNGDVTVNAAQTAAGDLQLVQVDAGMGQVVLDAVGFGGAIIDASLGEGPLVTAAAVGLRAGSGIGDEANRLEITAGTLAAETVSGDLQIIDLSGPLTIGTVSGVSGAQITGGAAGDQLQVTSLAGLTVNAAVRNAGGGNLTLIAGSGQLADDLTVNALVAANGGQGAISLFAGDSILLGAAANVQAAGAAPVLLSAGTDAQAGALANGTATGDILAFDMARIASDAGIIVLHAPGSVQLGLVTADGNADGTRGDVFVIADYAGVGGGLSDGVGVIVDGSTAETPNIVADQADLRAATGIGAPDDIDVNVNSLTALNSGAGDIAISDADSVLLQSVRTADGDITIRAAQSAAGVMTVLQVDAGAGRVVLDAQGQGGAIVDGTVEEAALITGSAVALRADLGIGDAANRLEIVTDLLAAETVAGDLQVVDLTGNLAIGTVAATAGARITGGGVGDDLSIETGGALTIAAPVQNLGGGNIELLAGDSILVQQVGGNGLVFVRSTNGAIVDGGDIGGPDLAAGQLVLSAVTGIGNGNALETAARGLSALNTAAGGIEIGNDTGGLLTIGSFGGIAGITTGAGPINLVNNGALTVNAAVRNGLASPLSLTALGNGGNDDHLTLNAQVISAGDVTLNAGTDLVVNDSGAPVDVGGLTVTGHAGRDVVFGPGVIVRSSTGAVASPIPADPIIDAPPLTREGLATADVTFGSPGESNLSVGVDFSGATFELRENLLPGTEHFEHNFIGAPNPRDPSAGAVITVTIIDDPNITFFSNGAELVRPPVVIEAQPPTLGYITAPSYSEPIPPPPLPPPQAAAPPPAPMIAPPTTASIEFLDTPVVLSTVEQSDVIRVVVQKLDANGDVEVTADGEKLEKEFQESKAEEILKDPQALFRSLRSGRFKILLRDGTQEHVIWDLLLRDGRPADGSEGTRDRLPTEVDPHPEPPVPMPESHPAHEHPGSVQDGPGPDSAEGESSAADPSSDDEQDAAAPVTAAQAPADASWAARGGRAWHALRSHVAALLSSTLN